MFSVRFSAKGQGPPLYTFGPLALHGRYAHLGSSKGQGTRPLYAGSLGLATRVAERILASAGRILKSVKGHVRANEGPRNMLGPNVVTVGA